MPETTPVIVVIVVLFGKDIGERAKRFTFSIKIVQIDGPIILLFMLVCVTLDGHLFPKASFFVRIYEGGHDLSPCISGEKLTYDCIDTEIIDTEIEES